MKLVRHRSDRLALVVEDGKDYSKVTPFDQQGRTEMWRNRDFKEETPIRPRSSHTTDRSDTDVQV